MPSARMLLVMGATLAVMAASARAGVLEDLQGSATSAPLASRFNFSGVGEARFTDGGPAVTPHNFNNQATTGGVSTFAPLILHLFLTVDLGQGADVFIKTNGGSDDLSRIVLDAMAIGVPLGEGWPRLEVGRFLENFGMFPNRFLPQDNPLIGQPLIHSYRTSLRPEQIPASAADLLSQRGQGQGSVFAGYVGTGPGLRMVSNRWYVNGLKLTQTFDELTLSLAVHNEAIGDFNFVDFNDTKTVTFRARYQPRPGVGVGASLSGGGYLDPRFRNRVGYEAIPFDPFRQRAWGVDFDYVKGHFRFFAELVGTRWDTPNIGEPLRSVGYFVEPTYRLSPRVDLSLRYGTIDFSDITTPIGRASWEFDVGRLEIGGTYVVQRDVKARVGYQWNETHDVPGGDPDDDLLQAQIFAAF